jgi:hypothetical protein
VRIDAHTESGTRGTVVVPTRVAKECTGHVVTRYINSLNSHDVYDMTSVFWPSDVAWSGICYGWDNPELCVAGVLVVEEVG